MVSALARFAQSLRPYADAADLPYLPDHLPTAIRALIACFALQALSAGISPKLLPRTFANMSRRTRAQWDIHVVSFTHAIIISPLAIYFYLADGKEIDPVVGYDFSLAQLYSVCLGYFTWDVVVSIMYEGPAFVVHGGFAMFAAVLTYRPLMLYRGLVFLLWEASTPFLNIHWFIDKLGMTGSRAQLINAAFLLTSYVTMRLTLGLYMAVTMVKDLWVPEKPRVVHVPVWVKLFYTIGVSMLMMLNYFWFYKMVLAVRKRFAQPKETQKVKAQ